MKDAKGRGSDAGSTNPQSPAHQQWAKQFITWSGTHAFGPSTVNASALREHMHSNNSEVQAAAAVARDAQAKVNETAFAMPYQPTPVAHTQALADAKTHLRQVENAARSAVKGLS